MAGFAGLCSPFGYFRCEVFRLDASITCKSKFLKRPHNTDIQNGCGVPHIHTDVWTDSEAELHASKQTYVWTDTTELHTFKRTHRQTLWSYTHSNGLTDRQTNTALYNLDVGSYLI